MSAHNDLDRRLTDFLRDGPTELPYQSFDAVRDRTEQTGQRVVIGLWRLPEMNKIVTYGLGAAGMVVVGLFLGAQFLGGPGPNTGAPSGEPTPTAEPSIAPPASTTLQPSIAIPSFAESSIPPLSLLPEGDHLLWNGGTFGAEFIVTIPARDWYGESTSASQRRGILRKNDGIDGPDGAGLTLFAATTLRSGAQDPFVYTDSCRWSTAEPEPPITTVDEAVAALSSQPSRDASAPVDISVGGYSGKAITLRAAESTVLSDCDQGEFRTMVQGYFGEASVLRAHDPGQIDKIWILNANGNLVIVATSYYEGTPVDVLDELDAIIESMKINA